MKNDQFLTKIHGFRGFSIILVLLFHFFENVFTGGYLGVDIFFIISGYIVTRSTLKYWPKTYSQIPKFIITFYIKRIARLLPVGLLVSSLSLIMALIFTSPSELKEMTDFYRGSFLGYTNFLLFFNNQNYFSLSQEFNFFTQTWSLGVEEQFYLIYSLLICLVPFISKRISLIFIMFTILSIISNLKIFGAAPEGQFYLIPFRLWEMGFGVVLSLKQDVL